MAVDDGFVTAAAGEDWMDEIQELTGYLAGTRDRTIGFPGATDLDYAPVLEHIEYGLGGLLNNLGDPYGPSVYTQHVKPFERKVVNELAELLRAPADDHWGYVTSGATEGTLYALWAARAQLPRAIVYYSQAAHPSVAKAVDLLGLKSIPVRADPAGMLMMDDLSAQIARHRNRPVVVVATIGTTMTEAVDDVRLIIEVLDSLAIAPGRRFVHADAALAGIPLALMDPDRRQGFDFADGADSVVVSGHKFFGTPFPCGVVLIRNSLRAGTIRASSGYTGSADATVTGSRNGYAALMLWYALRIRTLDEHRERADAARRLAAYLHSKLVDLDCNVFRFPHAFTVVIDTPPPNVCRQWALPSEGVRSHIVCMPGMNTRQLDNFLAELNKPAPEPPAPVVIPIRAPVSGGGRLSNRVAGMLPAARKGDRS